MNFFNEFDEFDELDENTCFGKIKYMNFIPYETIKEFISRNNNWK